jgi:hypothetical protein
MKERFIAKGKRYTPSWDHSRGKGTRGMDKCYILTGKIKDLKQLRLKNCLDLNVR